MPGLLSAPLRLPVTIAGKELSLDGFVIRPDRPGRFPLVIITHGTPSIFGDGFSREVARRTPVGFNKAAVAFAERGYAAVAIMRRGFGLSEGAYSENVQTPCDYLPAVRVSAEDVTAVVASLRKQSWVDADRVVLLGHSTGGLAVSAAAGEKPTGVVAILNFDGGQHGFSGSEACSPDRLVETFAALGRTARIPSLWLYAENDRSYGPDLARRMFDAYKAAGAPAELRMLPPFGSDGHDTITRAPADTWLGTVEPFLVQLGLPTGPVAARPPLAELPSPPNAIPVCQKAFADYLTFRFDTKAFAVTPKGGCGGGIGRTIEEAGEQALAECEANSRSKSCSLYAISQHLAPN